MTFFINDFKIGTEILKAERYFAHTGVGILQSKIGNRFNSPRDKIVCKLTTLQKLTPVSCRFYCKKREQNTYLFSEESFRNYTATVVYNIKTKNK